MKAVLAAILAFALWPVPAAAQAPVPEAPKVEAPKAETPKAKPRVRLVTSYGPVEVELEPALAPETVANFLAYVRSGFYAGTIFHRVIPDFMIQGGGLDKDLQEKPGRASIRNEAAETSAGGLRNVRGTIAMARTDAPGSATSQFFINVVDNPALDHKDRSDAGYGYCAFGRVVSGMEAVDKIAKVTTVIRKGMQNVPEYPVRIKSAEVVAE